MGQIIKLKDERVDLLPLSAVAFMPPFPNPALVDVPGELLWVLIDELFIDPRYQRPIGKRGEKNIRQVIENFSWSLFSPIVVAKRGPGRYAIIDGQHRAIAALTHGGIVKLPAYCILGDEHDEARAFSVINGMVTAILPTQLYHARVVARERGATELSQVIDTVGIIVLRNPKAAAAMKPKETAAVDAMEKCLERYGREVLETALRSVTDTHPENNPGYLRAPLLKATCAVLHRNSKFTRPQVLSAIRTCGIKYLWAVAEKKASAEKMSTFMAYSEALETLLQDKIKVPRP